MRTLIGLSLLVCCSLARSIEPADPAHPQFCPEGWIHYRESCYLMVEDPASLDQADTYCNSLYTTLVVPNTIQEFDFLASQSPVGDVWMGMFKSNGQVKDTDLWQVRDGINPHSLEWLGGEDNGWSPIARCGALTKTEDSLLMNFHPCYSAFNFICERNATLYFNQGKVPVPV